jgi:hypothetical protein
MSRRFGGLTRSADVRCTSLVVSILRRLVMKKFHVVRMLLAVSSVAAIVVDLGAGHKFFGA